MAARRGGLGKGLDSLIPETIKPAPQEKTKVVEKIVEKVVEKPVEQKVKLSKIGRERISPESSLMKIPSRSWQNPSNSSASSSHWWFRRRTVSMKLSQANAVGAQPRWRA